MKNLILLVLLLTSFPAWSYLGPTQSSSSGGSSITTPVSLTNGGTGAALTAINGGIIWSDGANFNVKIAGTSGQVLTSGGAAVPTWGNGVSGLTSLGAQTSSTQVFANDANVLITSSNNTHSLGWGSTLSLARGGLGFANTAIAGGVMFSTGSSIIPMAAGTTGQVLTSAGSGTPTWGAGGSGLTSLNGQTNATQVFANDANILVTSSSNTHSLGWGSTLSLARGGTQAALTAVNGGLIWSDASKLNVLTAAAGSSVHMLKAGGSGAPTWVTPPNSFVCLDTSAGYGAVNTKSKIYTNSQTSGTDITYATSANNGASFTINTPGLYFMTITAGSASGNYNVGFSKNVALPATQSISAQTPISSGGTKIGICSGVLNTQCNYSGMISLIATDIIRPQSDAADTFDSNNGQACIYKVSY